MTTKRLILAAFLVSSFAFAPTPATAGARSKTVVAKPRPKPTIRGKARKNRAHKKNTTARTRGSKLSRKLATRKPGIFTKRAFVRDGIATAKDLTSKGRLVEAAHVLKGLSAKSKDLTFREKNAVAGARAKLRRTALGHASQGRGELAREGARVNLLLNQPD